MNVAHLLTRQAAQRPDAAAIVEASDTISFAQLETFSAQFATQLHEGGVTAGDRVLVFVPMSIDLYVALIAVFRLGAVATFLDPSAGRAHIADCCAVATPMAWIATGKAGLLRWISPALRRIPRRFSPFRSDRDLAETSILDRADDDPALLTFTSGSTGRPKAAVRSHAFLTAQHAALVDAIDLRPGEIDLTTLPIVGLANLASGLTTLIPDADLRKPGAVDAVAVLKQIAAHRPTRCVASPAFFERLLTAADTSALKHFTTVFTGGAPVSPGLLERLSAATTGDAVAVYGSTEAEPIAHVAWSDVTERDVARTAGGGGLLAGKPEALTQTRVIAAAVGKPIGPLGLGELDAMTLAADTAGEIIVTGRHVLHGYLGGRGDEETKIRVDGAIWHRTGDAGYFDRSGRLWLLGRAEAAIIDDRGTLYPFAVEFAAGGLAEVRRAALISIEGKRVLIVELTSGSSLAKVRVSIEENLGWAQLDAVRVVGRIPLDKRHNAKVDYPRLRVLAGGAAARAG